MSRFIQKKCFILMYQKVYPFSVRKQVRVSSLTEKETYIMAKIYLSDTSHEIQENNLY